MMNTNSTTEYQWSVKLVGDQFFHVGIATKLKRCSEHIHKYDSNAIFYSSVGRVWDGQKNIFDPTHYQQESGDVISFKFHPKSKKLDVQLTTSAQSVTLDKFHWSISVTVKDNINYFPFAQLHGVHAREAILINPLFKNKKI